MSEVKDDRRYTKDHEWARREGSELVIGITQYAVEQLGDVTLVDLNVKPGSEVTAGATFGTVESVKTLSDLYAPVTGKVTRVNGELTNAPELVNDDPWGRGWMLAIEPADAGSYDTLLDAAAYGALTG
ncbi:MAG: glycine cleavage system protein GcvH [Polyangiaceae bacterium]|nr:glycine cleavage system protein GcvH [Polyangiaceae bacterium]